MKHLRIFTLILFAVIMSGLAGCGSGEKAQESSGPAVSKEAQKMKGDADRAAQMSTPLHKKYDIKSAVVEFKVDDPGGTHKELLYIDEYGLKERIEIYDGEGQIREVRLADGESSYIMKGDEKIAWILMAKNKNGTEMRFDKEGWQPEQKEKYKYQDKPDITVAGKTCSAYYMETDYGKVTYAGWSHITLYHNQETKFGNILREAVKIDENAAVPADKFQVPAGYEAKPM